MPAPLLETERLILRQWKESDLIPFQHLNKDPKVMEFFPAPLNDDESLALMANIQKEMLEQPYGLWAIEVKNGAPFIGFVGLHKQTFEAFFTPCIEIAWRLAYPYWRKGYAYEAAKKVLNYAFNQLSLSEVVAFTATINNRSIGLMKKLGMKSNPNEDFDHPKLKEKDPLKRHVLYRLSSP